MESAANPQVPAEARYETMVRRSFRNASQIEVKGKLIRLSRWP